MTDGVNAHNSPSMQDFLREKGRLLDRIKVIDEEIAYLAELELAEETGKLS